MRDLAEFLSKSLSVEVLDGLSSPTAVPMELTCAHLVRFQMGIERILWIHSFSELGKDILYEDESKQVSEIKSLQIVGGILPREYCKVYRTIEGKRDPAHAQIRSYVEKNTYYLKALYEAIVINKNVRGRD